MGISHNDLSKLVSFGHTARTRAAELWKFQTQRNNFLLFEENVAWLERERERAVVLGIR